MKDKIKANVTIYAEYSSPVNGGTVTARKIHLNGIIFDNNLPIQMQLHNVTANTLKQTEEGPITKFDITEVRFVILKY